MAKRSPKQLADSIRSLRWIVWEIVRIQSSYLDDVSRLRNHWEQTAARPRFSGSPLSYRRITAAREALKAFRQLEGVACALQSTRRISRLSPTDDSMRTRKLIMRILKSGRKARFSIVTIKKGRLAEVSISKADLLPDLGSFHNKWHMLFPLPPELDLPESLDIDIFDSDFAHPVKIVSYERKRLVLEIAPSVGREILLAFVEGAIRHALPLRVNDQAVSKKSSVVKTPSVRMKPMRDGRRRLEISLPCDLQQVRSLLSAGLKRGPISLREFREALEVGRLHDLSRLTFKEIAKCNQFQSKIVGGDEGPVLARLRLVRQRFATYQRLKSMLLR